MFVKQIIGAKLIKLIKLIEISALMFLLSNKHETVLIDNEKIDVTEMIKKKTL